MVGITIDFILKSGSVRNCEKKKKHVIINWWNLAVWRGSNNHLNFLSSMMPDFPLLIDCLLWQSTHYLWCGQFPFQTDLGKIICTIDWNLSLTPTLPLVLLPRTAQSKVGHSFLRKFSEILRQLSLFLLIFSSLNAMSSFSFVVSQIFHPHVHWFILQKCIQKRMNVPGMVSPPKGSERQLPQQRQGFWNFPWRTG